MHDLISMGCFYYPTDTLTMVLSSTNIIWMIFSFCLFKICINFLEITSCQAGDYQSPKGSSEIGSMPFPPGVGERSSAETGDTENYEVITADRAIDETNVGNRILRNMGWQEGLVSFSVTNFSVYPA
jgi:hypothetical protein